MVLLILFGVLWISGDSQYERPFRTSVEATYQNSMLSDYANRTKDKIQKEMPTLSVLAPIGYAAGVKKQFRFKSSTLALPNTNMTYQYNHNTHSGSVGITWAF
jgi:hypothetical protein